MGGTDTVWTPKRVVLLAAGFVLFVLAYAGYSAVLGGINGLPPLPPEYLESGPAVIVKPKRESSIVEKLEVAFGKNCEEINRPIRLDLHSKNMVLTADQFVIVQPGAKRVQLIKVSLGLFSKDRADGRGLEINTLKADEAFLDLDQPIEKQFDLAKRKIIAAELRNNIILVNNRRTPARDDDLIIIMKHGPLFYDEARHRVSTPDVVDLEDKQSKPKPITIQGKGLELELATETPTPKLGAPGHHVRSGETVSGVKRVDLLQDVRMTLYAGADSGFPGGARKPVPKPAGKTVGKPAATPEKAAVRIHTPGRFRYELSKDHDSATFDVPAPTPGRKPGSPEFVTVVRELPAAKKDGTAGTPPQDTLTCTHLELRLTRRQGSGPAAPRDSSSSDQALDIETAHATAPEVALSSDSEGLIAYGNDFSYDREHRLTVLKGSPQMDALDKEGNRIRARELQIREVKQPGESTDSPGHQQATALGPGTIDLCSKDDKSKEKPRTLMRASWNDRLVSTKDGPHDLLILTGGAAFEDFEHEQTLRADTLKVWLNPREDGAGQTSQAQTVSPQRARRPHHLEAVRNVSAHSAEMNIHDTSRLVVRFKDVPATPAPAAGKLPGSTAGGGNAAPAPPPPPGAIGAAATASGAPMSSATANPATEAKQRPIELSARTVEAWVLRSDARNTLERLETEGSVQVHQAPARPEEKPVDIEGDTLQMHYHPDGNYLVVAADGAGGGLAQLHMDRMHIFGTEVNINQRTNEAWVPGGGCMQMESRTNFQGAQLDHDAVLEIYWDKSMYFNGRFAEFEGGTDKEGAKAGGVQAKQEEARLTCKSMQVFFDRPISLKEGAKTEQPARVKSLGCYQSVQVEDSTFEGKKLVKFQRVKGTQMVMYVLEEDEGTRKSTPNSSPGNVVQTSGPGQVRLLQAGGADPLAPPMPSVTAAPGGGKTTPARPGAAKAPGAEEMKMTFVSFESSMYANNHDNKAVFTKNVRVLNFPCQNPNQEIDLDVMRVNMPEGGMYLECQQLDVQNRPAANGRSNQEMWARGGVKVQARDFWGQSNTVTYNEAKDQIIFEGGADGLARLSKVPANKGKPQEFSGKKIIYIRSTGAFQVDGGNWFTGQN